MRRYTAFLIGFLAVICHSSANFAAETDLVGRWHGTFKQIQETWTISHDADKWTASVVYAKGGEQVGASHGEDVKGTGHELNFIRVVDKKVDEASIDRQHCKLLLMADGKLRLEIKNGNGFFFKTLSRVEDAGITPVEGNDKAPPVVARNSEGNKPAGSPDPGLVGKWLFHGDRWDELWTVEHSQNAWMVNTVYTHDGQEIGAAHGEHAEYSGISSSLLFTRIFDKAPGGTAGQTSGCELKIRDDKLELHIKLNDAPVKLLMRQTPAVAVDLPVVSGKPRAVIATAPAVTPPAPSTARPPTPPATPVATAPPVAISQAPAKPAAPDPSHMSVAPKPAAKTPAVKTPAAKTPAVKTPAVKTPAVGKPAPAAEPVAPQPLDPEFLKWIFHATRYTNYCSAIRELRAELPPSKKLDAPPLEGSEVGYLEDDLLQQMHRGRKTRAEVLRDWTAEIDRRWSERKAEMGAEGVAKVDKVANSPEYQIRLFISCISQMTLPHVKMPPADTNAVWDAAKKYDRRFFSQQEKYSGKVFEAKVKHQPVPPSPFDDKALDDFRNGFMDAVVSRMPPDAQKEMQKAWMLLYPAGPPVPALGAGPAR